MTVNTANSTGMRRHPLTIACAAALAAAGAGAQDAPPGDAAIEEVYVIAEGQVFNNSAVTESMKLQQSPITSVNALIDNLPGVSIQEGDTYGFDDWSTTIAVRGFQNSLSDQQIGTTVDGIPNGGSQYGGGAKANRYLDPSNLETVMVSQGTADIASRALDALGGTINFVSSDPEQEQRLRVQGSAGEFDARRYFVRYDTGVLGGHTRAWISASQQEASDWINGAARNQRDHYAAKLVTSLDRVELTGYVSYDDIHEDNYQRLFSPEEFAGNDNWDRLTDEWTGVPWIDQAFREGWSTLRENLLAYVKAGFEASDGLMLNAGAYYHDNEGRGDWVPPYLVDVIDDQGGPESEALGTGSFNGSASQGLIRFVDSAGNALAPAPGCTSSLTFPYGGAGPEFDPACYPADAVAVQSYRHTNYWKERVGAFFDADWTFSLAGMPNTLRGGIWYEDQTRDETRDWHKITDTSVGKAFDEAPYWTQYDRTYPQETFKWYLEDSIDIGPVTLTLGAKQFLVDVERQDNFGEDPDVATSSDSDVLYSGGLLWQTPMDGLEVFAGYAENFKSITDEILERPQSDLSILEPETAENIELGLRYNADRLALTATYFEIDFSDRIVFLTPESGEGINFLIGTNGTFFNAGGIDSSGLEFTADYRLTNRLSLYGAYTFNDATYTGTGQNPIDSQLGVVPGNDVVGIPDQQLVLSLDWRGNRWMAGISSKYTGDRPIRLDNSWIAEDYITTDIYLTLFGESGLGALNGWSVTLLVNNAFDESYLGGIAGEGAWIGAPRTVSASFTLDL